MDTILALRRGDHLDFLPEDTRDKERILAELQVSFDEEKFEQKDDARGVLKKLKVHDRD